MDSGDKMKDAASANASGNEEGKAPTLRAYEPPRLRHLGSVRELTLGATSGRNDGSGGKKGIGSSIDFKENVHYLTPDEKNAVAREVLGLKLATYDYKPGLGDEGKHLGFIIEDAPSASFVRPSEKMVDVYALASALTAVVQKQEAVIARLEAEVAELKAKLPR